MVNNVSVETLGIRVGWVLRRKRECRLDEIRNAMVDDEALGLSEAVQGAGYFSVGDESSDPGCSRFHLLLVRVFGSATLRLRGRVSMGLLVEGFVEAQLPEREPVVDNCPCRVWLSLALFGLASSVQESSMNAFQ